MSEIVTLTSPSWPPAPSPCTTRPNSKSPIPLAAAQSTLPIMNSTAAASSTGLRPQISLNLPHDGRNLRPLEPIYLHRQETGETNAAEANRYELPIHVYADGEWNSPAITGMAVVMMVWSSADKNTHIYTTPWSDFCGFGSGKRKASYTQRPHYQKRVLPPNSLLILLRRHRRRGRRGLWRPSREGVLELCGGHGAQTVAAAAAGDIVVFLRVDREHGLVGCGRCGSGGGGLHGERFHGQPVQQRLRNVPRLCEGRGR
jgi:hypothetical protein